MKVAGQWRCCWVGRWLRLQQGSCRCPAPARAACLSHAPACRFRAVKGARRPADVARLGRRRQQPHVAGARGADRRPRHHGERRVLLWVRARSRGGCCCHAGAGAAPCLAPALPQRDSLTSPPRSTALPLLAASCCGSCSRSACPGRAPGCRPSNWLPPQKAAAALTSRRAASCLGPTPLAGRAWAHLCSLCGALPKPTGGAGGAAGVLAHGSWAQALSQPGTPLPVPQ